jgi:hypothetical protein
MRDDFAKLLVQTPRHDGSGMKYKLHRRRSRDIEEDEVGKKQGMRRPYDWNYSRKAFDEYLTPLVRMLKRNVGRPWDKVYSELSKSLHGGGTIIQHVKVHLFQYVRLHVQYKDGVPGQWPTFGSKWEPLRRGDLYVDQHGLLKAAKGVRKPQPEKKEVTVVELPDSEGYVKHEGIWYRVKFVTLDMYPASAKIPAGWSVKDVFLGTLTVRAYPSFYNPARMKMDWVFFGKAGSPNPGIELGKKYGSGGHGRKMFGKFRVAVSKRAVSNRELKKAGLK